MIGQSSNFNSEIKYVSMKNFNFGKVRSLYKLFGYLVNAETIDLTNANANGATNISYMFEGDSKLKNVYFDGFKTDNVTIMSYMFKMCTGLTNMDLSMLNTPKLEQAIDIFYYCSNLETVNLSGLGSDYLTNANGIFTGCSKLKTINMSYFNYGIDTDVDVDLSDTIVETIDLSYVNASNSTTVYNLFLNCSHLKEVNMSNFVFGNTICELLLLYNLQNKTD